MTKVGRIGRYGAPTTEIAFENGSTVNDLLSAAGETLKKGETLTIDGSTVKGSYVFDDGDLVLVEASTTGA